MRAREEILTRIQTAVSDRYRPPPIPREYHQHPTPSDADLVALFEERVGEYGAVVRRCPVDELIPTIWSTLAGRGAGRVVVPAGIPNAWLPTGVRDEPPLSTSELDRLDGVLTTCAVVIAETGTVVLDHGAGQGRRALTLVPDLHLIVIRTDQIVHSVPDAIAVLDPRRPMTWISGPSATSDIELSRVEGVHGPRKLDIIITA
jgi:L-lactate dehydrogenase complex protein LldG